jgi:site-specific DNA-cytosine methylase
VIIGDDEDTVYAFSHTQGLHHQANAKFYPTLRANGNGMSVHYNQQVRRLTPLECERLQGFPDDWTAGQADSHRYKQMGNAVAVPVVQWIIDGIIGVIEEEDES